MLVFLLAAGATLSGALPQEATGQTALGPGVHLLNPATDSIWRPPTNPTFSPDGQASSVALVTIGALGAIGGTVFGGLATDLFTDDLGIVIAGAFLGQGLAVPLAVHLGNGRRGVLWPSLLAGAGVSAAAVGSALASGSPIPLFAAPLIHIPVSIRIERHTARRRDP
jgi:hypothetical protein